MKTWWALESEVRAIARSQEPAVARLADLGFELLQEGQKSVVDGKWTLWEAVFGLALAQLENTSACAWEMAYAGYYVQSRAMARLMTEYLAVVWYLPDHPEEAGKWNDRTKQPPDAGTLLTKVFEEDDASNDSFHALRKHLHRFAHQDSVGILALYEQGDSPTDLSINARAQFVQTEFQEVARNLLLLHASIPAAMAQWRGERDPAWAKKVTEYTERVAGLVDVYDAKVSVPRPAV